jgi:hypothetical protein
MQLFNARLVKHAGGLCAIVTSLVAVLGVVAFCALYTQDHSSDVSGPAAGLIFVIGMLFVGTAVAYLRQYLDEMKHQAFLSGFLTGMYWSSSIATLSTIGALWHNSASDFQINGIEAMTVVAMFLGLCLITQSVMVYHLKGVNSLPLSEQMDSFKATEKPVLFDQDSQPPM